MSSSATSSPLSSATTTGIRSPSPTRVAPTAGTPQSASTLTIAVLAVAALAAARTTLDIYFIDVEGGQSTLIATPAGEALLVDTGFAGPGGGFDGIAGDPAKARDAQRIVAAARDAGIG